MCRLSSEMSDETTVLIRRPGRILLHDPQDEGRPLAVTVVVAVARAIGGSLLVAMVVALVLQHETAARVGEIDPRHERSIPAVDEIVQLRERHARVMEHEAKGGLAR